jgi:cold shock CspA family protein
MREYGVIKKYWHSPRGYGFIGCEGGPDLFFHVSELAPGAEDSIRVGVGVEFEVTQDGRGRWQAAKVTLQGAGVEVQPEI